jgi:hypothetical protein
LVIYHGINTSDSTRRGDFRKFLVNFVNDILQQMSKYFFANTTVSGTKKDLLLYPSELSLSNIVKVLKYLGYTNEDFLFYFGSPLEYDGSPLTYGV